MTSLLRRCLSGEAVAMSRRRLQARQVLCVAEKNDAAKGIADILSGGRCRRREGFSKFNKIYEYEYNLFGQNIKMVMTSVSGHLLELEFKAPFQKWYSCNPVSLFDAEVEKYCPEKYVDIKRTLEREVHWCQALIIWTDCDREGENIGFEVIHVCKAVKPNLQVLRARFSEITPRSIRNACENLLEPDQNISDAVEVRQELDLRIGASFTRFQTLRLQKIFPNVLSNQVISYGSCQFPTLGFVVERFKAIQAFIPEPFYKIKVTHEKDDSSVEFNWKRNRLFNHTACLVLYQICMEDPVATVLDVFSKPKSKWRPLPLDTVEFEKLASRKLRINAKETMRVAEKLYTQGYISYPRTETNIFPKDLNLSGLVQLQTPDPRWGGFAQGILDRGGPTPRNGSKTDQAHPPIHPTKYTNNLQVIPVYESGATFQPSTIEMVDGETSPPQLLTEADLIALMEKHGIGTDATHAEHIEKIKSRMYVGLTPDQRFLPGELGMGLVEGYDSMGYEMSKPDLRAELEGDLKLVCEGRKDRFAVLQQHVLKYKQVFIEAVSKAKKLDEALSHYFGEASEIPQAEELRMEIPEPIRKCPQCGRDMFLKQKRDGGYYLSCVGYPSCKCAAWFPDSVLEVRRDESVCPTCKPHPVHRLKFKFRRGSVPVLVPLEFVGCIGGCDEMLREILDLRYLRVGPLPLANSQPGNQPLPGTARNQRPTGTGHNQPPSGTGRNQPPTGTGRNQPPPGTGRNQPPPGTGRNQPPPGTGHNQPLGGRGNPHPGPRAGSAGILGVDDDNMVVCNCGQDALLLTVRKDGPNQGRKFYKCSTGNCNFFLWADQSEGGGVSTTTSRGHFSRPSSDGGGGGGAMTCTCNEPVVTRTVQKDGPNKGRAFHTCAKPREQQCGYFQWVDENSQTQAERRPAGNAPPAKRARCCGLCHQPGHTRTKCPQNR
ncbi:DNA topoisomerase 3-alpha isoform X2 [Callorhinchus milii]|uniref:DNA topoisomerase 3-alpha isoform X2 n=1 Tax=Callorhinchus milii TaxID=7868 RepID=UPI001C3F8F9E|nr:DNA topoisomerase 3-alpha isoform X2 [Callorhinchus milii]